MIRRGTASLALAFVLGGCGESREIPERTEHLRVTVTLPDGSPAPLPSEPAIPLPIGLTELLVDIEAQRSDGSLDVGFDGYVRISVEPGTVVELIGPGVSGRNALLIDGVVQDLLLRLRNVRGETRVWAEDIGYVPTDPLKPPACGNGIDDDSDGNIDFPNDAGCAFANDDTETGGTYATGVSPPVHYQLPRLADFQGVGASSPYDQEGVVIETKDPANMIVTRISSDGFYATDLTDTRGYNHVFAFTFNTPGGLRVCDRITGLSGTSTEFFGFTELSFPSFDRHAWVFPEVDAAGNVIALNDGPCQVPEPALIDGTAINPESDLQLEPLESALVRLQGVRIGAFFGPEPALGGFDSNKSNCDLDDNGLIDFDTPGSNEAACANACADNADCVEWTAFQARGTTECFFPGTSCAGSAGTRLCSMQINTRTIAQFSPPDFRGQEIVAVTGTLRNFSGGDLNWTIETRCNADFLCDNPADPNVPPQVACDQGPSAPVSSQLACVFPRTIHELDPTD